ncbi:hypothetical protein ABIA69_004535 [Lysinibacillus parviboronicapiens]|uniref:Uncharacterized protein n=1 Tax=Lysinibacillus parviboronicapiens TaxID=436516 RepID=A0ABV2PQV5_9BACI
MQSINLKRHRKKKEKSKQSNIKRVFSGYGQGMDKKRFFLEIMVPLLLSVLSAIVYFTFKDESLIARITTINSNISTVVAIQIGFNITSLALIASFGESAGKKAFNKVEDNDETYDNMNQITSSYVYNISIYILLLIWGFIHLSVIEPIFKADIGLKLNYYFFFVFKWLYFTGWSFLILHGFIVFMRNVVLIQLYLLSVLKNNKSNSE